MCIRDRFDCEEDAIAAIKGGKIVAGDVVVIRYEGPKGGPGMRGRARFTLWPFQNFGGLR